jgi:hypothetical protein
MTTTCCRDLLLSKVPSQGRQLMCHHCLTIWTGRAGAWVSGER